MAENTYKGFLDNTGLEYLLNNILAHKKNIKTLTINNSTYDPLGADNTNIIIDAASLGLENALHFIGKQDTLPNSANNGDIVLVGGKEYVYSNGAWVELGDEGSHALKTIKISAGTGLIGGGTLADNMTISHADTSNVENVAAADRTYIKSLTFDGFGHVTGVTTGVETIYTLPIASTTLGGVKTTSTVNSTTGLTACPIIDGVVYYKDVSTSYTLPVASNNTLGGVKIGYSANGQNYPVQLDSSNKMYVNVPWTDTNNTITTINKAATLNWNTTTTIANVGGVDITVKLPANPDTNTTYNNATQSTAGLMSAADKIKLDGIATGATANVGTITGVSINGTNIATSGIANIPVASTNIYGVVKLSSSTSSTSTVLAATASAVKNAYDLANSKQDALNYTPVRQGGGSGQGNNTVYIGWSTQANGVKCQIDSTDMGFLATIGTTTAHSIVYRATAPSGNVAGKIWLKPVG